MFGFKNKATDPVCLMKVTKEEASVSFQYEGKLYYFCSTSCYEEFRKNPAKYAD